MRPAPETIRRATRDDRSAATRVMAAHAREAAAVATALGVDPAVGLDDREIAGRRESAGENRLEAANRRPLWRMVLSAATEPFVILLFAAGCGAVLLGEVRDGLLVLLGLLPIIGADVITGYRGERALEALRAAAAPRATVRRSGALLTVPATELVPGDIVLFRVGDVLPADLRVVRADRVSVDRSLLTGESLPEPAHVEPDAEDAPLADRRAVAFGGTSVVAGRGEGIVIATGAATEVGRIAGGLEARGRRRSPLQLELDRLVRILLVVAAALIAITSGLGFVRGNSIGENVLAGISAAIAAIPEEPPILLAVVLGLGAYRLLRRGVLVRRLNAEEILGAVDLVITDKTGTLTENRLAVASLVDAAGPIADRERRLAILRDALRAEDDAWGREGSAGVSSFTGAIVRSIEGAGGDAALDPSELVSAAPIEDGRPYSITRARRGELVEEVAIGAPEAIALLAEAADSAWDGRGWRRAMEDLAARGERVVGLARRIVDGPWLLEALLGFADSLRPEVAAAAGVAHDAGIQVVMVTGDHPSTAASIGAAAGLPPGHVALGAELQQLSDLELTRRLPSLGIVARSTPDQKRRIVEVARAAGRLVAVTGDGVNDAPALQGADVAVSMGSGTAVAREASDLVLTDDSFATLVYAIGEGRRIVDNVQKGLVFLVSTHVALLGFLLVATLAGISQPLLPIQILWLELFIDVAASIAFEREPAEPNLMTRPPRPAGRPLLDRRLLGKIAGAGGFSALAALGLVLAAPGGAAHAQWLAFTTLVCAQVVRAYANRSLTEPVRRLGKNGFLLGACVVVVAIQAAMPYVPVLADAFRAEPLGLTEWLLVAAVALAPALLSEVVRSGGRRRWVA